MVDKPCCAASAARKVKQLNVNGNSVGIAHLDETIDEIKAMGLQGESEIGDALLRSVRIFNYVPSSAFPDYKKALLDEYKRRR